MPDAVARKHALVSTFHTRDGFTQTRMVVSPSLIPPTDLYHVSFVGVHDALMVFSVLSNFPQIAFSSWPCAHQFCPGWQACV
eukprot:1419360-Amphidinium_carterae.1